MQRTSRILVLITNSAALWARSTSSISYSGYPGDARSANPYYSGELNDINVLGSADAKSISETDIKLALENRQEIKLRKDSKIIVIQSGAIKPAEPMIDERNKNFIIISFSGATRQQDRDSYSKTFEHPSVPT